MSLNNFIPTLWSGELLKSLLNKHVYAQCLNRDYEGVIKAVGDSVRINSLGAVTIGTYAKYGDIGAPEILDDASLTLVVDQQKFFNFQLDDIDVAQQKPKVRAEAMRNAAWGLADVADSYIAAMLSANVATANILTPSTPTATTFYELLVDLSTKLSESNIPEDGRWVVIPPRGEALLRKDARFVSFGTSENRRNLRGQLVRNVAGLDVMVSNKVPVSGNDYTLIAGYDGAATFAEQIPPGKVEAYRPERSFTDAMKGLHVYGGKVIRPTGLAKVVATIA